MSGATNWSGLAPLTVSAYPDDTERVYYPDRSRGIRGFNKVVVRWDPNNNMYRWKPHQEYTIKYPGVYQLEAPPGYCLLYQPVIRVDMTEFMDYLKQASYTKVIEYPEKVKDPTRPEGYTWNYEVNIHDTPTRDVSRLPDPPVEVPDPKASEYVTILRTPVIPLPHSWEESNLLVQLRDDAPLHNELPYEGHLIEHSLGLVDHFSADTIEIEFDGNGYYKVEVNGTVRWQPTPSSTDGLWHKVLIHVREAELLMSDDVSFRYAFDEDVAVAPGTGLLVVYADDDVVLCDMHWNPVAAQPLTVHIDRAFVYNGYSSVHNGRAELRIGARSSPRSIATFVPASQQGVCTLLLSPDWINVDFPQPNPND